MKRKDPQAKAAYAWENDFGDWNRATCSLETATCGIEVACDMYNVPMVNGVFRTPPKLTYSIYDGNNRTIHLKRNHVNPATALHEVAHHIAEVLYGTGIEDHGREWLGIYADLLVTFKIAPADAVYLSLKARKLKFINIVTTPKEKAR